MKKFAAILAAVVALGAMAAPAAALTENGTYGDVPMYTGEIVIDGQVDEIYKKGLEIAIDTDFYVPSEASGTVYVLHDGEFLYVAAAIQNGSYAEAQYAEDYRNGADAWCETGCEVYVDWSNDAQNFTKIYAWYNDMYFYDENGFSNTNDTVAAYDSSYDAATNSYVIEVQFQLPDYVEDGADVGFWLAALSNDNPFLPGGGIQKVPDATAGINGFNQPANWYSFTLSTTDLAAAEETDAPAADETDAPAADETDAPAADETVEAPATFDAAAIFAVVAAVTAAGALVSKKRR